MAILIGRFGHKMHLVTYTTRSANLMLREIGIVLFLASVGIEAGEHFVQTVVEMCIRDRAGNPTHRVAWQSPRE